MYKDANNLFSDKIRPQNPSIFFKFTNETEKFQGKFLIPVFITASLSYLFVWIDIYLFVEDESENSNKIAKLA